MDFNIFFGLFDYLLVQAGSSFTVRAYTLAFFTSSALEGPFRNQQQRTTQW